MTTSAQASWQALAATIVLSCAATHAVGQTIYSFESGVGAWVPNDDVVGQITLSAGAEGATDGVGSLRIDKQPGFQFINDGFASFGDFQSGLPAAESIAFDITIPDTGFASDFLGVRAVLNDNGGFQQSSDQFIGTAPGTQTVTFPLDDFWTQPDPWTFEGLYIALNTGVAPSTLFLDNIRLLEPSGPVERVPIYQQDFDCGTPCDPAEDLGATANYFSFGDDISATPVITAGAGVDGTNALQWTISPFLDDVVGVGVNAEIGDGSPLTGAPIVEQGVDLRDLRVSFDLSSNVDMDFTIEMRSQDPSVPDLNDGGTEVPATLRLNGNSITAAEGAKTFDVSLASFSLDDPGTTGEFRPDLAYNLQLNFFPQSFLGSDATITLDNVQYSLLIPVLAGDYNDDGVVDAADYTVYRDSLGSLDQLPNDTGLATPVGEAHLALWRDNFGATNLTEAVTVPEPASLLTALAGIGLGMLRPWRSIRDAG